MGKNERSQYQQSVISGYYKNLDSIMLQKLSELVSELYLAETKAKHDGVSIDTVKIDPMIYGAHIGFRF